DRLRAAQRAARKRSISGPSPGGTAGTGSAASSARWWARKSSASAAKHLIAERAAKNREYLQALFIIVTLCVSPGGAAVNSQGRQPTPFKVGSPPLKPFLS